MRGKYSPTVDAAYTQNKEWFRKFCDQAPHNDANYNLYDPEGYDSYGYDKNNMDRAGNYEHEYYSNDYSIDFVEDDDFYNYSDGNSKYDSALDEWTFDGVKPVSKYAVQEF